MDSEPLERGKVLIAPGDLHMVLVKRGEDGARGLLALRNAGSKTFAQDEKTCVVYGMPRKAFEAGGVQKQVALGDIATHIVKCVAGTAAQAR